MILQIMKNIQYFVLFLAVVLTGFSMAFWLISYPDYSLEFGTIQMAFLNTYLYMLGQNISTDFSATASPRLGILLLVMFMFFMMILMLNLLIALMGNSYSKVQEKGPAEWRLGQASMMMEQSYMLNPSLAELHERYSSVQVMQYNANIVSDQADLLGETSLLKVVSQLQQRQASAEAATQYSLSQLQKAQEEQHEAVLEANKADQKAGQDAVLGLQQRIAAQTDGALQTLQEAHDKEFREMRRLLMSLQSAGK